MVSEDSASSKIGLPAPAGLPAQAGKTLHIYTDGGARGNPGPAGIGIVIKNQPAKLAQDKTIKKISQFIGKKTNNQAEYEAVIKALEEAKKLGGTSLEIFLDSSLLVNQLKGNFKVKNEGLKKLFETAKGLISNFKKVNFYYIPRQKNKEADKLVNKAINLAS